jgi:hypothetical protein
MTGVRIWMYQGWSSVIYLRALSTVAAQRAIDVKETSGDRRRKQKYDFGPITLNLAFRENPWASASEA